MYGLPNARAADVFTLHGKLREKAGSREKSRNPCLRGVSLELELVSRLGVRPLSALMLSQAHAWSTAIIANENDSTRFQCPLNTRTRRIRHSRSSSCFNAFHGWQRKTSAFCQF
jgi:hypothetical protein